MEKIQEAGQIDQQLQGIAGVIIGFGFALGFMIWTKSGDNDGEGGQQEPGAGLYEEVVATPSGTVKPVNATAGVIPGGTATSSQSGSPTGTGGTSEAAAAGEEQPAVAETTTPSSDASPSSDHISRSPSLVKAMTQPKVSLQSKDHPGESKWLSREEGLAVTMLRHRTRECLSLCPHVSCDDADTAVTCLSPTQLVSSLSILVL